MTWFQWLIVGQGALTVLLGLCLHNKPKTGLFNFSDVLIRLALLNWMLWYAGAWN